MTRKLWGKQNPHPGDRQRLFTAVSEGIDTSTALNDALHELAHIWVVGAFTDETREASVQRAGPPSWRSGDDQWGE